MTEFPLFEAKVFPESWEKKFLDVCVKQTVIALLFVRKPGELLIFVGSNWCSQPQKVCPRAKLPSGYGYWMCRNICNQGAHAEIDACMQARELAKGSKVIVYGHTRICENCIKIMKEYGVKDWLIATDKIEDVQGYLRKFPRTFYIDQTSRSLDQNKKGVNLYIKIKND